MSRERLPLFIENKTQHGMLQMLPLLCCRGTYQKGYSFTLSILVLCMDLCVNLLAPLITAYLTCSVIDEVADYADAEDDHRHEDNAHSDNADFNHLVHWFWLLQAYCKKESELDFNFYV